MKRVLVFLVVLAVALGGLFVWWQRNATRVITEQVRAQASSFFANPDAIEVTNEPVRLSGLRQARVPKIVMQGQQLALKGGGTLASTKIVLYDVEVTGPPFRFTALGADSRFQFTVTDKAVTDYIHQRGISVARFVKIPADTVGVSFSRTRGVTVVGTVALPLGLKVPITAYGDLVPSAQIGQVDFRVRNVAVSKLKQTTARQVTESFSVLNPIIDVSDWPVMSEITAVKTGDHTVTIAGTINGVR